MDYAKEIVALIAGALNLWSKTLGRPRTSMVWGQRNTVSHVLPDFKENGVVTLKSPILNVGSVLVRNTGKTSLSEIEVILNYAPNSLNIWPVRPMTQRQIEHDRFLVTVAYLPPGEELWLDMVMVHGDVPAVLGIRSKEVAPTRVGIVLTTELSNWRTRSIRLLAAAGVAAIVYGILQLLTGLIAGNWSWLRLPGV
ncbi:hypothetical protein [Stenotrophomonas sepilia]|uniref:hypothetical protein n=1 Tax=Stenotrophomonas sepilia TaxID=2860290 RepID=UPI00333EB383